MKSIIVFSFIYFLGLSLTIKKGPQENYVQPQETIKTKAFKVLILQCNACHASKKKQNIFTLDNMDSLAPEIYKQVFIKKKMPKGRKNILSVQESESLQKWLNEVLKR